MSVRPPPTLFHWKTARRPAGNDRSAAAGVRRTGLHRRAADAGLRRARPRPGGRGIGCRAVRHDARRLFDFGHDSEDAADRNTADGRPATFAAAHARIARMLCADMETSTEEQRRRLADAVLKAQSSKIDWALDSGVARVPAAAHRPADGRRRLPGAALLARVEWGRRCKEVDLERGPGPGDFQSGLRLRRGGPGVGRTGGPVL